MFKKSKITNKERTATIRPTQSDQKGKLNEGFA